MIDILQYIGEPVTNENYEHIKTNKKNYSLEGLSDLEDLNSKIYKDGEDKESIPINAKKAIDDYIFDVIRIDKKGNENIDFVDIFIRLNQNPCPIAMNSFEMWNSFDVTKIINKIKEVAKYKAFKQQGNHMKEEEIVTTLAYMNYKEITIETITEFFKVGIRTDNKGNQREKSLIKIAVKNKEAITKYLEKMEPDSKAEEEFLECIDVVSDFVDKLKVLSNHNEKELLKILNPTKEKPTKGDKNCFYIMWLVLKELDTHLIKTYHLELQNEFKQLFKLMQNMPKDKDEKDFIEAVKSIIREYSKKVNKI